MKIEYEATFINVDKDEIRQRLVAAGAKLVRPELFLICQLKNSLQIVG